MIISNGNKLHISKYHKILIVLSEIKLGFFGQSYLKIDI